MMPGNGPKRVRRFMILYDQTPMPAPGIREALSETWLVVGVVMVAVAMVAVAMVLAVRVSICVIIGVEESGAGLV